LLLLNTLSDVDRPEDLKIWENELAGEGSEARLRVKERSWAALVYGQALAAYTENLDQALISVIIPTLNEVEHLGAALKSVKKGDNVEIIVSDGGSDDGTLKKARSMGARVIDGPRNRAAQMNLGAQEARGAILLFLHADTILPDNWDNIVRNTLKRPGNCGGAFQLKWDRLRPGSRLIEKMANFRSARLGLPYGDQALFITKSLFQRLHGFKNMRIMEDYEFAVRLRRLGNISLSSAPVITSARKAESIGFFANTLLNQTIIILYELGISDRFLARLNGLRK
jgi:rSAM/selenodomain-associated transferase 2